jgi:6-methylsalicylate decarboxylase
MPSYHDTVAAGQAVSVCSAIEGRTITSSRPCVTRTGTDARARMSLPSSWRKAVVFLHPTLPACVEHTALGYPPSLIEFVFDTSRAVMHLALGGTLERCPDLTLIVPHAGGTVPFLVDRISLLAARFVPGTATHAPAGVEAYFRRLYYDLAISANPHAVASVLQLVGPERLLYGSDWPALDEADVHTLIQVLDGNPLLQPEDRARIERRNALKLFPRLTRLSS